MLTTVVHPSIFPLGDAAITIDLGNHIDEQLNRMALTIREELEALHLPGIKDIIVAYGSVSIFYDPVLVIIHVGSSREGGAFGYMREKLESVWQKLSSPDFREPGGPRRSFDGMPANAGALNGPRESIADQAGEDRSHTIRIPVCYEREYGPDLDLLAGKKGLTRDEVIRLHTADAYRVYMIGFLPGFPYLGKVAPALEIPRKERPVPVVAGGVGIAGNQTGIYPLHSPGGWQIIGRTPLKLFDPSASVPVSIKVGDWVQFFPITQQEFRDFAARST